MLKLCLLCPAGDVPIFVTRLEPPVRSLDYNLWYMLKHTIHKLFYWLLSLRSSVISFPPLMSNQKSVALPSWRNAQWILSQVLWGFGKSLRVWDVLWGLWEGCWSLQIAGDFSLDALLSCLEYLKWKLQQF